MSRSSVQNAWPRLFVLAVALLPALARAELPKVIVVPYAAGEGAAPQTAQRFTQSMVDALRSRSELQLLTGAEATAPAKKGAAPRAGKSSAEATAALDSGQKAYGELKFEEALPSLKKGIELSLADPATADWPRLYETHLQLAVSAFRLGEDKEAQAALQSLARMNLQYEVPGNYPPVFLREWEKARKKVDKQGRQQLTVDGPPGATAFIDGRDLGMVPVEEPVSPGAHHVKVEGTKGERWGQTVEVKGAAVKVKGSFGAPPPPEKPATPAVEPKIQASLDAKTAEKVAAWCAQTGADFAVVGIVWKSGEGEVSAASAVYWTRKEAFAPLPVVVATDKSLGITEAAKVAAKLLERVESFGASLSLPHALVPKPKAGTPDEIEVATVKPRPTNAKDAAQPKLVPDAVTPDADRSVPIDEPPPEVSTSGGGAKWVWIVVGVAAAAGAGVGTYFIVSNATRPVTGTVTASW